MRQERHPTLDQLTSTERSTLTFIGRRGRVGPDDPIDIHVITRLAMAWPAVLNLRPLPVVEGESWAATIPVSAHGWFHDMFGFEPR